MAQRNLFRSLEIPYLIRKGAPAAFVGTLITPIDATDEQIHYIGHVMLENPTGGSKTISSAGGKIHWQAGAVTFVDPGTTLLIGIEDVSATTAPAQGDGIADVSATLVGGTDVITSDVYMATPMEAGSKVISHGQLVAVSINLLARAGADTLSPRALQIDSSAVRSNMPTVTRKVGGIFAATGTSAPNIGLEFDDGTVGWLSGGEALTAIGTVVINVDTAPSDEYGNFIQLPVPMTMVGAAFNITLVNTSADFEVLLYSDPLGTPSVLASVVFDATQAGAITSGYYEVLFTTPILLEKDTPYVITIRPTTTNDVTLNYQEYGDAKFNKLNGLDGNCYSVRRIDNIGAFTDYNGGVAKTRIIHLAGLFQGFANDDGNGAGSSPTGFSNSELGL